MATDFSREVKWVIMLIPMETYSTCDFRGGSDPCPPPGPADVRICKNHIKQAFWGSKGVNAAAYRQIYHIALQPRQGRSCASA